MTGRNARDSTESGRPSSVSPPNDEVRVAAPSVRAALLKRVDAFSLRPPRCEGEPPTLRAAALGGVFTRLCEQLADDLRRKGYAGRTVGIKLRYADFKVVTRDHRLTEPVQTAHALRQAAGQALRRAPLERPLRLLGVRVGGLCRPDAPAQAPQRGKGQHSKRKMPLPHTPPEQQALFFE